MLDAYAILAMDPIVGCNLYLLKVELHVLTYIVTDDCNSNKLRRG